MRRVNDGPSMQAKVALRERVANVERGTFLDYATRSQE
jgi:hypothetical protein